MLWELVVWNTGVCLYFYSASKSYVVVHMVSCEMFWNPIYSFFWLVTFEVAFCWNLLEMCNISMAYLFCVYYRGGVCSWKVADLLRTLAPKLKGCHEHIPHTKRKFSSKQAKIRKLKILLCGGVVAVAKITKITKMTHHKKADNLIFPTRNQKWPN